MTHSIILTTGIYDLIKDLVRKKKVSPAEAELLDTELKHATQVTRKNLPPDVVTIDSRVTFKDLDSQQEEVQTYVAPKKAKQKHNTKSILSEIGLALVGYRTGDKVTWPFPTGVRKIEIVKVERLDEAK